MTEAVKRRPGIYTTWDGPGSEYLGALYFPIFSAMQRPMTVVQFTYGTAEQMERATAAAQLHGVNYRPVPIRAPGRRSPRGWLDAVLTAPRLRREVRRLGASVVGTKSVIPATIALGARRLPGEKFGILFDADGLMQDERADFMGWSTAGAGYRLFRELEYRALLDADAVVTRTERSRIILAARRGPHATASDGILVVPNGKDERRFAPPASKAARLDARVWLGLAEDAMALVYAGSLGPQYFPEVMFELHRRMYETDPRSRLVVLTPHQEDARTFAQASPVPAPSILIRSVAADEVPRALSACDVGLALRMPTYSQVAVSPIKVGEYLLCGLPVVATRGVGDLDALFAGSPAVCSVASLEPSALDQIAQWALGVARSADDSVRQVARQIGKLNFGLSRAAAGYEEAFDRADPDLRETARADRGLLAQPG